MADTLSVLSKNGNTLSVPSKNGNTLVSVAPEAFRKYSVDIVLMGTLNYESLPQLYKKMRDTSDAWKAAWYLDPTKLAHEKKEENRVPTEAHEKIYNLIDIGVLSQSSLSKDETVKTRIFLHDGLSPSFQIRARLGHESYPWISYEALWELVRKTDRILLDKAQWLGLSPETSTWTVTFHPDQERSASGKQSEPPRWKEIITEMFKKDPLNIEGMSSIGTTAVIKLLEEGREQYLILSAGESRQTIAISHLYYLTIAKSRIKSILGQMKTLYIDRVNKLEDQFRRHKLTKKVKPAQVSELLTLRQDLADALDRFRTIKAKAELVRGFVDFHAGTFLNRTDEINLDEEVKGFVEAEKDDLDFFYLGPLRTLTTSISESLEASMIFVATISDIFNTKVNLQLQTSVKTLSIIATFAAVASVLLAIITFLR